MHKNTGTTMTNNKFVVGNVDGALVGAAMVGDLDGALVGAAMVGCDDGSLTEELVGAGLNPSGNVSGHQSPVHLKLFVSVVVLINFSRHDTLPKHSMLQSPFPQINIPFFSWQDFSPLQMILTSVADAASMVALAHDSSPAHVIVHG